MFANFLVDVMVIFPFVMWFWLLIVVFGDLFQRRDISGWGKAVWVIFLLVLPYLGVLVYIISQARSFGEREDRQALGTGSDARRLAVSVADELGKLEELKSLGKITDQEFARLRVG